MPRSARLAASLAATIVLGLLGGCTLGPDFVRPKPPAVDGYTAQPMPAKTAAADVPGGGAQEFIKGMDIPGQWWTLFRSEPLNRLIEEALRANPSLQAAHASLRQARETLAAQQGTRLPSVTAGGSAARDKISDSQSGFPGVSPTYNLFNASVSVGYDFDVFGGEKRQTESLEAQAENQRFQLESAYLTLTSNVVTAAVQEASLRAQIAATEDIISAESEQLGVLQQQFQLGGTSRSDVLLQEATLDQERAGLPALQNQLSQTRNLLVALAGRLPSQDGKESFELTALQLPQQIPVSLPSKLVEQRPDVRAAEALVHSASAQIGVARAAQFPDFTLSGQVGVSSLHLEQLFVPASRLANLGGSVAQSLFDGDALYHKKQAAIAAYDAAEAQYRNTVLTAFENVADSLRALDFDATALRAQLAAEQSAADSLSIARLQYQAGAITYVNLLNAELQYQTSRIALVKAEGARYADTAALFQSLGGGWWNRTDAAEAASAR